MRSRGMEREHKERSQRRRERKMSRSGLNYAFQAEEEESQQLGKKRATEVER